MKQNEIESYVKAGEIAKEVKSFARGLIKPGVKLIDIADGIDAKIVELGGEPAFPVNLSLNEIAAHYTPAPGDTTVAEGLLKVDIGVAVDGYIADTAFSVDLTKDGEFKDMLELNEKLLAAATAVIKDGVEVHEVGDACQDTLEEWNNRERDSGFGIGDSGGKFAVIKSLCGHSLAQGDIHAGLTISNYRNENKTVLDDMAFAIEPFVTTGVGDIYEGVPGGIYVLRDDKGVRDRDARTILAHIKEKYGTLPFCMRWLASGDSGFGIGDSSKGKPMTENKIKFSLAMMVKQGILHHYPLLIEKSKKPVSQFENTFVVSGGKVWNTTGE